MYVVLQIKSGSFQVKTQLAYDVFIILTTRLAPNNVPSSGHKTYDCLRILYSVIHKMGYNKLNQRDLLSPVFLGLKTDNPKNTGDQKNPTKVLSSYPKNHHCSIQRI